MKHTHTLSNTHLWPLLWAGLMAPTAELFPSLLLPGAGRGVWLSVLLGGLAALAVGALLVRAAGPKGLSAALRTGLGKGAGTVVLLIYIGWFQLLLTLRLNRCAARLLASGERDGSLTFFLLVLTLLLLRLNRTSLSAFARAGQVFLAALLGMAAVVLALSLPTARLSRLLPLELPPLSPALLAAGVLGWGFPVAFLLSRDNEAQRHRVGPGLLGVGLLAASQALILSNLGPGLAASVDAPFFALAKGVGIEGAFQRIESLVAAVWIFADLTMAGILSFAQRAALRELVGDVWAQRLAAALLIAGGLMARWGLAGQEIARYWSGQVVPVGNWLLALLLPALVRLGGRGTKDCA